MGYLGIRKRPLFSGIRCQKLIISFLVLSGMLSVRAKEQEKDSPYFLFMGVQVPKQQLEFATLNSDESVDQEFLLDPNPKKNLTLSLHHKAFSFFLGFPIIDPDKGEAGKSESLDFRFRGQFKRLLPFLYFQKYKGFSLKNKKNPNISISFFPQVETLHYGAGLTYYFDETYSSYNSGHEFFIDKFSASFNNRWDSSYLLSSGIDRLSIKHLPALAINQNFSEFSGQSTFQTLHVEAGGSIQYALHQHIFEVTFLVGPGFTQYRNQGGIQDDGLTLYASFDFMVIGHFRKHYFWSGNLNFQSINGGVKDSNFNNVMNSIEFSFGRSF
ncbi:MAG: hypothetical protein NXH75_12735 [Halobacteriovoraceae bacterium]|nr:hypothetical protein [Halobacteriovoraceae bacterium]